MCAAVTIEYVQVIEVIVYALYMLYHPQVLCQHWPRCDYICCLFFSLLVDEMSIHWIRIEMIFVGFSVRALSLLSMISEFRK